MTSSIHTLPGAAKPIQMLIGQLRDMRMSMRMQSQWERAGVIERTITLLERGDFCPTVSEGKPSAPPIDNPLVAALQGLLDYVDRQTCTHEDRSRMGTIWTVCTACGRKWADDEGGFQTPQEAPEIVRARAELEMTQRVKREVV